MSLRNLTLLATAVFISGMVCVPVSAGVTYGDNVQNLLTHFWIADAEPSNPYIDSISGLAFDPTHTNSAGNFDKIYLTNRSTNDDRRGLYSANIFDETYTTRLAASGMDDNPADLVVDGNGDVYVVWDYSPQIWKVADPSGTPVETQLLGNYGFETTDDDPYSLSFVPPGFGGGFDPGVDLVVFDGGLDNNDQVAVTVVDSASTPETPAFTIVWSDPDDVSMNGRCSPVDGYAYFTQTNVSSASLGTETLPYISRVKSDGVLERVFLDMDSMATEVDNVIAVNPVDGSVWIPIRVSGEDHVFYRIDVLNATDQGSGDFLAPVTAEITLDGDDGFNVGTNGLAFSPDGKYLAVGAPSGRDSIYVYQLVPEPGTMALLGLVGLGILLWRRRL